MNRRDSIRLAGLCALGGLFAPSAPARRLFPENSTDHFTARQRHAVVGFKSMRFSRSNGRFLVDTEVRFDYRGSDGNDIPFSHVAREQWTGGFLSAFSAETRHAGRITDVRAESMRHAILLVRSNTYEIPLQISGYVVPSTLWHRDTRLVNRLLDLVDGRLKLIQVFDAGEDVVNAGGKATPARHFQIRGEFNRDVWYTADCRMVRVMLPLANAPPVTFELGDGKT